MKSGLLGILATGGVLARNGLDENKYVEHIYKANCKNRLKDIAWVGYVNLSISRINGKMLNVSEDWPNREGEWWAVLSFDPVLLGDPGVYFTSTNNTYPTCSRDQGLSGLEKVFADEVEWGYYGYVAKRTSSTPFHYPTHEQAEVLYPDEVPLSYLRSIYVRDGEQVDQIHHFIAGLGLELDIEIKIEPGVFS